MSSGRNFTIQQRELIDEIKKLNLFPEDKIRLLVLMATNNYARTKEDLAGILCEYPGLSDQEKLCDLIDVCLSEGYLTNRYKENCLYFLQDENCLIRFLIKLPEDLRQRILKSREEYDLSQKVIVDGKLSGGARGGLINAEFRAALKGATLEILLPMFNTYANPEVIEILKERAKHGVQIRILLADEKVVKKYRPGRPLNIKAWTEQLKNQKNVEIRVYNSLEEGDIYSSVVIDGEICKMCVFDIHKEASSQGTIISCSQDKGKSDINLIKLVKNRFWEIWSNSYPVNENKLWSYIKKYRIWLLLIIGICCLIYLYSSYDLLREVSLIVGGAVGQRFFFVLWHNVRGIFKNMIERIFHFL